VVTTQLVSNFPTLIDTDFTSGMEEKLDHIESGEMDWLKVLQDFYTLFSERLETAYEAMEDLKANPKPADQDCDKCGKPMVYRFNKNGRFIACSGYPDCKNTISVNEDGENVVKEAPIPTDEVCDKCGASMVIRKGKRGQFMACSAFPKCKNTISVDENLKPLKPKTTGIKCEKCSAEMVIKYGRRGGFLACSGYPKCRNAKPLPDELREKPEETDKPCPECGKKLLVRWGGRGVFGACSGYRLCIFR
jgi:DNA topoisomerase-1